MWKFSCVMRLVFFTFGLDQHWSKRGWIGWDGYPHCSWHQSRPCTRFWMLKGRWRHCLQRTLHYWQQRSDLVFYSIFVTFRICGLSYALSRSFFLNNWPLMLILGNLKKVKKKIFQKKIFQKKFLFRLENHYQVVSS